jgi:hypothetical protein
VKQILSDSGFQDVTIISKEQSEKIIREWNGGKGAEKSGILSLHPGCEARMSRAESRTKEE